MSLLGLDLGSHSFKAVEVKKERKAKPNLLHFALCKSPPNSISSEAEVDHKAVSEALKKFISENNFTTRRVVASLPESSVFTRVISLPLMSQKELDKAMRWEAEQYIPISLDEVSLDYQILEEKKASEKETGSLEVLLVAAPKAIVNRYVKILEMAGLEPLALETETMAIARSLVHQDSEVGTMLVNIGATTTDIAVISKKAIRFTRSISTGGTALARAVAQSLGFEMQQAEEYKKSYGLDQSQLEGKVMEAIKPVFDVIVAEMKRSLAFYYEHHKDDPIKNIIICGGTASLPGLIVYLAAILDVEVQLSNPWQNLVVPSSYSRQDLEEQGPSFAVAAGLALKEI